MGYYSFCKGIDSISLGDTSYSNEDFCTSMGYNSNSNGKYCSVVGNYSISNYNNSTIIGNNILCNKSNILKIGNLNNNLIFKNINFKIKDFYYITQEKKTCLISQLMVKLLLMVINYSFILILNGILFVKN